MSRRNHQYRVRLNEKEYLDLQFLIEHGVNPAKLFRDAIALKTLEIPGEPSIDFDILKKSANAVATAFSAAVTALYEEEEEK
jgi:hypothetical protein